MFIYRCLMSIECIGADDEKQRVLEEIRRHLLLSLLSQKTAAKFDLGIRQ